MVLGLETLPVIAVLFVGGAGGFVVCFVTILCFYFSCIAKLCLCITKCTCKLCSKITVRELPSSADETTRV